MMYPFFGEIWLIIADAKIRFYIEKGYVKR